MGAASHKENRWSKRRQLALQVEMVDHGQILASCRTRDIGLGGVFLEADQQQVSNQAEVDLLFSVPDDAAAAGAVKHRLRARVVRIARDGFGLMFKDFDTRAFRSLQAIMSLAGPEVPVR